MNNNKLIWMPRILAILYIIFVTLFAWSTFTMSTHAPNAASPSLWHFGPSALLLIFTLLAWFNPKLGGLAYIALGTTVTVMFIVRSYFHFSIFMGTSFPILLIGALFFFLSKNSSTNNDAVEIENSETV